MNPHAIVAGSQVFYRVRMLSGTYISEICMEPSRKPLNLLVKKLNSDISIRLKNDIEYRGKMIDCDSHMNIILNGATEYRGNSPTANFGNLILRGSNILYVCVNQARQ